MRPTARRCSPSPHSWSHYVRRGEVFRFRTPKGVGHEQQGVRYGVVVQADELLPRSVVIVAPTSRSARPASFRPEIAVARDTTRVLVEQ
ncbi:MAG: type II toxin-antitoxin system PemK/MazF family toxin, partial [Acidimicrobiia bacterium]|nr:type II toxin-antitoxin system PemK/MazF family toxin [Acidimicrobiia bacterium]